VDCVAAQNTALSDCGVVFHHLAFEDQSQSRGIHFGLDGQLSLELLDGLWTCDLDGPFGAR